MSCDTSLVGAASVNELNPELVQSALFPEMRVGEVEDVIRKHGYIARILQAFKCNFCAKNFGRPSHNCPYCNTTGYIYRPQAIRRVYGENPAHCNSGKSVFPLHQPIEEVKRLMCVRADHQEVYRVTNISDRQIDFDGNYIPKKFDPLLLDYSYRRTVEVVDEIGVVDGTNVVTVACATATDILTHGQRGDLEKVTSVVNTTTNENYTVVTFEGQRIKISGAALPTPGQVVKVSYRYAPLTYVVATNVRFDRLTHTWTNLESGTLLFVVPDWIMIGEGDVIVPLGVEQKRIDPVVRDPDTSTDALRAFDVRDILEIFRVEEPTKTYAKGQHYVVEPGNLIKWISPIQPPPGALYSVSYTYSPAYKIYEEVPSFVNAENKKFPKAVTGKFFDRLRQTTEIQEVRRQ